MSATLSGLFRCSDLCWSVPGCSKSPCNPAGTPSPHRLEWPELPVPVEQRINRWWGQLNFPDTSLAGRDGSGGLRGLDKNPARSV